MINMWNICPVSQKSLDPGQLPIIQPEQRFFSDFSPQDSTAYFNKQWGESTGAMLYFYFSHKTEFSTCFLWRFLDCEHPVTLIFFKKKSERKILFAWFGSGTFWFRTFVFVLSAHSCWRIDCHHSEHCCHQRSNPCHRPGLKLAMLWLVTLRGRPLVFMGFSLSRFWFQTGSWVKACWRLSLWGQSSRCSHRISSYEHMNMLYDIFSAWTLDKSLLHSFFSALLRITTWQKRSNRRMSSLSSLRQTLLSLITWRKRLRLFWYRRQLSRVLRGQFGLPVPLKSQDKKWIKVMLVSVVMVGDDTKTSAAVEFFCLFVSFVGESIKCFPQ